MLLSTYQQYLFALLLAYKLKFEFYRKLNVFLQKVEDEILSYEYDDSFFNIKGGDVILSRSNRIQVAFRSGDEIFGGKGFLASFQAGNFL